MVIIHAGAVVADAFTTLCQWKWFGGFEGLFSRIICACMDPKNRGRDFAATVFGGVWFIGELAGRVTWENVPCFKGLSGRAMPITSASPWLVTLRKSSLYMILDSAADS